jgi:hypothetical protein
MSGKVRLCEGHLDQSNQSRVYRCAAAAMGDRPSTREIEKSVHRKTPPSRSRNTKEYLRLVRSLGMVRAAALYSNRPPQWDKKRPPPRKSANAVPKLSYPNRNICREKQTAVRRPTESPLYPSQLKALRWRNEGTDAKAWCSHTHRHTPNGNACASAKAYASNANVCQDYTHVRRCLSISLRRRRQP